MLQRMMQLKRYFRKAAFHQLNVTALCWSFRFSVTNQAPRLLTQSQECLASNNVRERRVATCDVPVQVVYAWTGIQLRHAENSTNSGFRRDRNFKPHELQRLQATIIDRSGIYRAKMKLLSSTRASCRGLCCSSNMQPCETALV